MSFRALVAYSASSTHVQTTLDYLLMFKKYAGFDTRYVHVTHNAAIDFDFDEFDVVFHNYCARLCFDDYVSENYKEKLRKFKGVKILAVQDEYDRTNQLISAIKDLGFDIVLTCVPQDSLKYVYPIDSMPGVEFITVFTGYVSDDFETLGPVPPPLAARPNFIGYRGRDIGGRYGRLGFDKYEIGRRMKEICDERGLITDIAMDEASRIYGMAWFDYLGRCRSMLGSESGSNVFDFDGSIESRFKAMTLENGGKAPDYSEFLPIVAERDGEIEMGQISPRVFECALMKTPMVLFRGRYSDAIEPGLHYIALDKDFANVDNVLQQLQDTAQLEAMTERAYDHLVRSGRFNYKTFFGIVGQAAGRHLSRRKVSRADASMSDSSGDLTEKTTFRLRSGRVVETHSATPDTGNAFKARTSLTEIALLDSEDERLSNEFLDLRTICSNEMVRLEEARRYLIGKMPKSDVYEGNKYDELKFEISKIEIRDLKWNEESVQTKKSIEYFDFSKQSIESDEFLFKANSLFRERYKELCHRFSYIWDIYEREKSGINQEIEFLKLEVDRSIAKMNILEQGNLREMGAAVGKKGLLKIRVTIRYILSAIRNLARPIFNSSHTDGLMEKLSHVSSEHPTLGQRVFMWLRTLARRI